MICIVFLSCAPEGLRMSFMLDENKTYSPTNINDIILYLEAPSFEYEIIAYVEGSSGDYFDEKKNLDLALKALKKEAARIGATGLIIDDKKLSIVGSFGSMFGSGSSNSFLNSFSGFFNSIFINRVHLQAKAIYYKS